MVSIIEDTDLRSSFAIISNSLRKSSPVRKHIVIFLLIDITCFLSIRFPCHTLHSGIYCNALLNIYQELYYPMTNAPIYLY